MAQPNKNLAESLRELKRVQQNEGNVLKTDSLSRTHKQRLIKNGFIKKVLRGWYIISNPNEKSGDTTSWYSSFWDFCAKFLEIKYKSEWCISAEQSVLIHSGNWNIPNQLIIKSPKANNGKTELLFNTSLFSVKSTFSNDSSILTSNGLRIFSLPMALVNCNERFFEQNPLDARTALLEIKNSADILRPLLENGRSIVAGRLIGAFRNIGNVRIANDILETMKAAGYDVRETDPFKNKVEFEFPSRVLSPYITRIKLLWTDMRNTVIENFPQETRMLSNIDEYLKNVDEIYTTDAYHSLSIEGYIVTPELIERVANGSWDPDNNEEDRNSKNAMAAKGYLEAFKKVKESIRKVLQGGNPGFVVDEDHGKWYLEMFSPSVSAGILKSSDLAGYRNGQVFIRNSNHIPMQYSAVRDVMPVFFELLENEENTAVRAVLGHFIFVFIHPYMDGNGRIARFLMNVMLASGGYPWTVIPVEQRNRYFQSLEEASVKKNIESFTKYLAYLVNAGLSGTPIAQKP